mgnify:CR=1 FL=1|tara:strand:+ start:90 stop:752 length:663 start_codon:yes stop_codon:yes gene_type:complete
MKVNGQLHNAQVEAVTNTAARPAAGQKGRILYDLALSQLIYDNGSAWELLPKQSDTNTKSEVITYHERHTNDAQTNIFSSGTYIPDLQFNALPVGRYRLTGRLKTRLDGDLSGDTVDATYINNTAYIESFNSSDVSQGNLLTVKTTHHGITISGYNFYTDIVHIWDNAIANAKLKVKVLGPYSGGDTGDSYVYAHSATEPVYLTLELLPPATYVATTDWA